MNNHVLNQLKSVLIAQSNLIKNLEKNVDDIEIKFEDILIQTNKIAQLNKLMTEIESDIDFLTYDDVADWSDEKIVKIYLTRKNKAIDEYRKIQFETWEQFVDESYIYCLSNGLETVLPWEALLSDNDIKSLTQEDYYQKYNWNEWDYVVAGASGILASLIDYFWVAIPKDITIGVYSGQKGSVITQWLDNLQLPPSFQKWLETVAKVPYDNTGGGDHRIDTFGHDPILGFIIGTIDIMRGGATTLKGGRLSIESGLAEPLSAIESLIKQFVHLLSDVTTSKGLPVPFSSIIRSLNVGSFPRPNGKTATISQLALWMYHNGYDLRHFITMGITPAVIEIIIRLYLMIQHYIEEGETKFLLASNPKYRSILLFAHAVACAGNAGKIALYQRNPLAINYTEWLALFRYLIPSIKYWIFDKQKLPIIHLNKVVNTTWVELIHSSKKLLEKTYIENLPLIPLGENSP